MIYFSIARLLESFGPWYFHCLGFIGLCRKVFGAFSQLEFWKGLRVTIDCKPENGHFKTRGVGKLDEEGKFKVSVHRKIVKDGKLNEECYAQLQSASAAPCPAYNGLESSKVVFKSKAKGKYMFGLPGKLKFSL